MFLTIKQCTELFEIELLICIKMDLALNNLQRLTCHETQTTNQPYDPNFDLINVFNLKKEQNSLQWCCIENTIVHKTNTINLQAGFYSVSAVPTKLIVMVYGILKDVNNKKWIKTTHDVQNFIDTQ